MNKKEVFIKNLKRVTKEDTQAEISEKLGVSLDAVKKWFSLSSGYPTIENLLLICDVYDCDLRYLFSDDEDHFNADYQHISELTGLSSQAIRTLSKIENEIQQDSYGSEYISLNKGMLDYLLTYHPDFVSDLLHHLFALLNYADYTASLKKQIPSEVDKEKKRQAHNSARYYHDPIRNMEALEDIELMKIQNIVHDLHRDFLRSESDRNNFYSKTGLKQYNEKRSERFNNNRNA